MADDWKPGDLALCVNPEMQAVKGGLYVVFDFVPDCEGNPEVGSTDGDALEFVDLVGDPCFCSHCNGGDMLLYDAWRFRKINPLSEDEEFEELAIIGRAQTSADAMKRGAIVITKSPKLKPAHNV
jgi:hypothetical protein